MTLFRALADNLTHFNSAYANTVVCALCLREFGLDRVGLLSEEHPVPSKLKGVGPTLTCRNCNNTSGYQLETHLINAMLALDGMEGSAALDGTWQGAAGRMRVSVMWGADAAVPVEMRIIKKATNPAAMDATKETLVDGIEFGLSLNLRFSREKYWLACFRSAYLACFEVYGYEYVFSPGAEQVRDVLAGKSPIPKYLVMEAFPCYDPQSDRVVMPTTMRDVGEFFPVMLRFVSKRTRYVTVMLPGKGGSDWALLSNLGTLADRLRVETLPHGSTKTLLIPMGVDPISDMRPHRYRSDTIRGS